MIRRYLSVCFAVSIAPAMALHAQTAATAPQPDSTQSVAPRGLDEVVVTAQKRQENVQTIPIAITAVSGSSLAERQVNSVSTLSSVVPNMTFGTDGGSARISIRGIGFDTIDPGSEARVAYHIDGIYVSRPGAQLGTLFDVDRVEVLSGPQGTLYGRNATGGSINVITNQPTDELSGYARLTGGNYGTINSEAAISGPVADGWSARLAVSTKHHDGYGTNIGTGHDIDDEDDYASRATIKYQPFDHLTFTLSGDFFNENDAAYGNHYLGQASPGVPLVGLAFGGQAASDPRDIASAFDPTDHRVFYGFTGIAQVDLGEMTFKSITGYRHSNYTVLTDLTQTTQPAGLAPLSMLPYFERAHQLSEELQLSGKFGASHWIGGLYFFDEHIFGGVQVPANNILFGGPNEEINGFKVQGFTHTKAAAGYGQLELAISDPLSVTLGARYGIEWISIHDDTEFDLSRPYVFTDPILSLPGFPRSADTEDHSFTPKIGLQYQLDTDVLLYASVSKGFKSGGFNLGVSGPAFRPETLWDYEAGLKGTWLDRRLRANTAVFYYRYSDLQVTKVVNTQTITENAATARLYGLEEQITLIPAAHVQIDANLGLLHSEYLRFESADPARPNLGTINLAGNKLYEAPEVTVNLGAQYDWDLPGGDLKLRGETNYVSRNYFTAFDTISQGGNVKYNAFLTFEDKTGAWTATVYGRNLTNKLTVDNALISSGIYGFPITGTIAPPRTFGAVVGYGF